MRVHYLDEGSGPAIVLIHGNAMSSQDFVASGIVEALVERHRVIAIDRPGFGYSERPRGTDWTPVRQAELLHETLVALRVEHPIVVGHSLGSLVTVALAIAHPEYARALVLLSGWYYPTPLSSLPLLAIPTLAGVGDVMRFTISPVFARLLEPAMIHQLFGPSAVTESFLRYPLSMSRRPSQLRATAEDANYMDAAGKELEGRYRGLTLPIEIVAGDGDLTVNTSFQSGRLAGELRDAHFDTIPDTGHMIHHVFPERVLRAIDAAERRSRSA